MAFMFSALDEKEKDVVIDAMEERDIAPVDLPGHFLQTDMDERLILKVTGVVAMMMVQIDPDTWKPHL